MHGNLLPAGGWDREAWPGQGVKFEATLIYNYLYQAEGKSKKFVPILFGSGDARHIPEVLQGFTFYAVDSEEGYKELYRHLTGQPRVTKPPLGDIIELPSEPALGKLSGVPELPQQFLARPKELKLLKEKLLAKASASVGLTGKSERVGVHGMGGIGKSVLATVAARDEEVRRSFPDGVIWVALGQEPQLTVRQRHIAALIGGQGQDFKDAQEGRAMLEELFREKSCLLVVDDVWEAEHAKLFNVLGPSGKLLITTRNRDVLRAIGAREHSLNVLDEVRALEMLSLWSGTADLPTEAKEVVDYCGGLPLALAVAGARVKEDGILWSDVLDALKEAELGFLDHDQRNVLAAIESSVLALGEKQPERYLDLAVFFEEAAIAEPTLILFWQEQGGLRERDARALVGKLEKRALIRTEGEAPNRRISLHDLQRAYVRRKPANLVKLHGCLVDAYQKAFPEGWATGKNDGYYFQYLLKHLKEAGRREELRKLLLNFDWIDAKLEAADVISLIADYPLLENDPNCFPSEECPGEFLACALEAQGPTAIPSSGAALG